MIPVQKIMTTGHRAGRICTDLSNYKLFLKETFFGQPVVADFFKFQPALSLFNYMTHIAEVFFATPLWMESGITHPSTHRLNVFPKF